MNFIAEDSIREAQSANWPNTPNTQDGATPALPRVRLWASDLVALIAAMRARRVPSMPEQQPTPTNERAARDAIKD